MIEQQPLWAPVNTVGDLGGFIRELRLRQGLTQAQLATELGVTRQYVTELEQGKSNLYTDRLFQSLRLLGGRLRVEAVER